MSRPMKAALIETRGLDGRNAWICTGHDAISIFSKFMQTQDLYCLVRMGRMLEDDQSRVDALEAILDAYDDETLSMDDIRAMNLDLADGAIWCSGIAGDDEAIDALQQANPKAICL